MTYQTRQRTINFHDNSIVLEMLLDKCQVGDFSQSEDEGAVNENNWPIFGQLWPSGHFLADQMSQLDFAGKKILEIGCGLALPSLILTKRGASVTAMDYHPEVKKFLEKNVKANTLNEIRFFQAGFKEKLPNDEKFDLIIGSDVLYERHLPKELFLFLKENLNSDGEVILVDPCRSHTNKFVTLMKENGFNFTESRGQFPQEMANNMRYRFMRFKKSI